MAKPRIDYGICNLCEASCGIAVEHDGEEILGIRGDDADPMSRGHICPKALGLADVRRDPDRVRAPIRREGSAWEEVGWDEALDEIAARIVAIQREHGPDAAAFYYGNPTGHSYAALLFGAIFSKQLGTRNLYSSNAVDGLPRMVASILLYGSMAVVPIPDLDRARLLVILGANPVVSNGSIMTAPGVAARLREVRARGGKIVVVDPRRTETAEIADVHHFIRPGTDALLLAAMIHVILRERRAAPGKAARFVSGLEELPALFAPFSPDRVAPAVGIDAGTIAALAREIAGADTAVVYGRMGTCVQAFGTVTTWLLDLVNILTGRLDAEGGVMFPSPAADLAALAKLTRQTAIFDRWRSRVGALPELNGETPAAVFAAEMETPGKGQIRALITHAGNPALSLPNGRRLDRAFAALDLMVSIDIYRNETTRHAHFILPSSFGLERDDHPLLFAGLGVRNHARYAKAILPRPPGTRDDWEILLALAARIERARGGIHALAGRAEEAVLSRIGPRGLLAMQLRLAGRGLTLDEIERAPHGLDLGPLEPRLPGILATASGKIDLAPEPLVRDLARLRARLEEAPRPAGELLLVGRRSLRSNNSWMHNCRRLVKGREACTLLVHPDDARARKIAAGDRVEVVSRVGRVEVGVEISDEIMAGVVSLPHGWGHDREGAQLSVAQERPGVSVNDLTDDALIDAVSGASALNGVPVTVSRLAPAS